MGGLAFEGDHIRGAFRLDRGRDTDVARVGNLERRLDSRIQRTSDLRREGVEPDRRRRGAGRRHCARVGHIGGRQGQAKVGERCGR